MSNSIEINNVRDYIFVDKDGRRKMFLAVDGKGWKEDSFLMFAAPNTGVFTFGSRYRVTTNPNLELWNGKRNSFEYIDQPLAQKLENQYKVIKNFILNSMLTEPEQRTTKFDKVDGCDFYVDFYVMFVSGLLTMFARFFHSNKIKLDSKASKLKKTNDEIEFTFMKKAPALFGLPEGEDIRTYNYPKYVQNIRKTHFKRRTKTQEIIDFMRKNIQEYAHETLEKIYQNNLEIMKTLESEKTKE